jgi:hypothetical protein
MNATERKEWKLKNIDSNIEFNNKSQEIQSDDKD